MMSSRLYKKKPTLCAACGAYNEADKKSCTFCRKPLKITLAEKNKALLYPLPIKQSIVQRSIPSYYNVKDEFFYPPPFWQKRRHKALTLWRIKLLGGVAAGLLVLATATVLTINYFSHQDERAYQQALELSQTNQQETARQAWIAFQQKYPHSAHLPLVQEKLAEMEQKDIQRKIEAALKQSSYSLRLTEIEILLHDYPNMQSALQQMLKQEKSALATRLQEAKAHLKKAQSHLHREFYSAAIRELYPLIQEGSKIGVIYDEARQLFEKAHIRRIRFYLVKGRLPQARKAIHEAESMGLERETIQELLSKVKGLERIQLPR